ncbi:MAG: exo-beta-N-acetylmuramidase NamZ domain-containing protein [Chitinophagales bacterium]
MKTFKVFTAVFLFSLSAKAQAPSTGSLHVIVGAERTSEYLPQLTGKNVALVVNQTSLIGKTHIVDSLLSLHIAVKKIFAPEHGFRGTAGAGVEISDSTDSKTGIPIISLYGKNFKPTPQQLKGINIVVYDIQDVGVRFYTFISTLHYVMEACAENHVWLLILDRPDPNGFYVDGPVLDSAFHSFVGVDPVPIVYGMTPAEYASMLNGEHWLKNGEQCDLHYVLCENYTHKTLYQLPVNPSPNLRNMTAIYLYPSLCLFEGTEVSVGRGTDKPFVQIGYPGFKSGNIKFIPRSAPGATNIFYLDQECSGFDLSGLNEGFFAERKHIFLQWLMEFYYSSPKKKEFFTDYFDKLVGNDELRDQIEKGTPEMEIRRSWEPQLSEFKTIRKKYLLYTDFE